MEQYLSIHGLKYDLFHIENNELISGLQSLDTEKKRLHSLIDVYSGMLNKVGDERTALSSSWWRRPNTVKAKAEYRIVNNNARNYLEHIKEAKSKEIMWTRFKKNERGNPGIMTGKKERYRDRFLACNARATNKWSESTTLAYLVNVFPDPSIIRWFNDNGGNIDADQYALSSMLQWIWRSAIRDNKHINIYIPSKRMREMLNNWLTPESEQAEQEED